MNASSRRVHWLLLALFAVLILALAASCGKATSSSSKTAVDDDDNDNDDQSPDDDDNDDQSPDDDDASPPSYWTPSTVVPIDVHADVRGMKVERGMIHIHSVYSHDACDNDPMPGGVPNRPCLEQFRTAMCTTNQQYIMLTDHAELFGRYDYPAVLLYDEAAGDQLVYSGAAPIANIISCPDGNKVILMSGSENNLMPIHLMREPDGTPDERVSFLEGSDEPTVQTMQSLGAEVIINHSEEWTTPAIAALTVDGIEVYNLHANLGTDTDHVIETVIKVLPYLFPYAQGGHPDLLLMAFFAENTVDIGHIDVLTASRRLVYVMATDVHRNSLPFPLSDGDRGDSYRRLMRWFANYILTPTHDVPGIEEALAKGRLYGAFQLFGEPVGFDFYAETASGPGEMGDEVKLSDSPVLHVAIPTLYNMDPSLPAPEISGRIIEASASGGAEVAHGGNGEPLTFQVTSTGSYRAEIRIVPHHLRKWLGGHPDEYIHDYPLIYSNTIYVK